MITKESHEERGEDPREPITELEIENVFFTPVLTNHWASQARSFETGALRFAKRFGPLISLAGFGGTLVGISVLDSLNQSMAQAADCDPHRFLSLSNRGTAISVASQCDGSIFNLLPWTANQEKAHTRGNALTTNLGHGDPTGWLNFPAEVFPLDRNSGGRLVADDYMTDILSGAPVIPEISANWNPRASERINALQDALNMTASKLWQAPVTLDYSNIRNIYFNDMDQPNKISDITVDALRSLGVNDNEIFGKDTRIEFNAQGNPVAIWEWQTGIRTRVENSPNTVISALKSNLGNYFTTVEEDDEGRIAITKDPEAFTVDGSRSQSVLISAMLIPLKEDINNMVLVISDRSCGNIIAIYSVPIGQIEEQIATLTTATETPTQTPTPKPAGQGGGGGGSAPAVPTEIVAPTQVIVPTAPAVPTERVAPTQIIVPTAPPPRATERVAVTQAPIVTRT